MKGKISDIYIRSSEKISGKKPKIFLLDKLPIWVTPISHECVTLTMIDYRFAYYGGSTPFQNYVQVNHLLSLGKPFDTNNY